MKLMIVINERLLVATVTDMWEAKRIANNWRARGAAARILVQDAYGNLY